MRSAQRYGIAAAALVTALMTVGAVTAWACTANPTLNLDTPTAPAGGTVTVTGSSLASLSAADTSAVLRWNRAGGPVLATVTADQTGGFGPVTVTVPQVDPGFYAILATSPTDPTHIIARAAIQVETPQGAAQVAGGSHGASTPGSGSGPELLAAAIGVGGLALFGFGAVGMVRSYRRAPSASRVRR